MDFGFTPEQDELRSQARRFLDEQLPLDRILAWSADPAADFLWTPSDEIRQIAEKKLSSTVRLAIEGLGKVPPIVECVVEGPPAKALVEDAKRFLAESKKHHADARAKIDHANAMWKAKAALAEAESAAAISTP